MLISNIVGNINIPALGFLSGLLTLFTPAVIFAIIWMIIYTSKLQAYEKSSYALVGRIFLFTLGLKIVIVFNILDPSSPIILQDHAKFFKYLILLSALLIGVWLLNGFNNSRINVESGVIFRWLIIFIISLHFFLVTFNSSAPIFGTLVVSAASFDDWPYSAIQPLIFFSLGLLLPSFFIVYLSTRWFMKIGKKTWVIILQIAAGVILTGSSFVRFLLEL